MPSRVEVKKDALISGLMEARTNILEAASALPAR